MAHMLLLGLLAFPFLVEDAERMSRTELRLPNILLDLFTPQIHGTQVFLATVLAIIYII